MNVAIIGAGYMAEQHIKTFQTLQDVSILSIVGRTYEKAHKLASNYGIPHVVNSISELSNFSLDLVVVAITETSLIEVIDDLIASPWTLLLEKPIGLSLSETMMIAKKIKNSRQKVFIGLNRRFYDSTIRVLNELKKSKGKRFIHVIDHQSLKIAKKLKYSNEVMAGWMYKNSIHTIDYFNFLARSRIKKINLVQPWLKDSLKPVLAHIHYENDDEGFYQGVWHGPGPWAVSVTTEEHYFEMKPLEKACFRDLKSYEYHYYPINENPYTKPGLINQAKEVLAAIKGFPNSSVTIDDTLVTVNIINAIYGR